MIAVPSDPAQALEWLSAHRLLPMAATLNERGLISDDLATLARPLAMRRGCVGESVLAHERRVVQGLADAGVQSLVLKGCLLAYRAYPDPRQRWRADLDVLVPRHSLAMARRQLEMLGYRPIHRTPGGTPIRQESWFCIDDGQRRYVDVHWDLRDHPLLRGLLSFDEQYGASRPLPALAPGARGQGDAHALLNAAMHWYDDLYEHDQPLAWLLDIDLLWRAMTDDDRETVATLAVERGIAGLVADMLARTRDAFATPVPDITIRTLNEAGRTQPATRLIAVSRSRYRSLWFALRCEPGWRARVSRLRHALVPPIAHMRERYPEGSRFGLPGLYLRRIWRRVKS